MTRTLSVGALLALYSLCVVTPLIPQTVGMPPLPGEKNCPVALESAPGPWYEQEKWAWDKICLGEIADLSEFRGGSGSRCDLPNAVEWDSSQKLTARFLETIMFHEPYRSTISRKGLRVTCGRVDEVLDISLGDFPRDLWLENMFFSNDINAVGLHLERSFSLSGSVITGELLADDLSVGLNLFLTRSVFDSKLKLESAKIGSSLYTGFARFEGPFLARHLLVSDNLNLHQSVFSQEAIMDHASIGGEISTRQSVFFGSLSANHIRVGSDLNLGHGHDFQSGKVSSSSFRDIRMRGINVGGDFSLSGTVLDGTLDLAGSQIRGSLVLGDVGPCAPERDCEILFRNMTVGSIHDYPDGSWAGLDGRLDLVGFVYRGFDRSADRSIGWLINWLKMQRNPTGEYLPMPYQHLAGIQRRIGYDKKADKIAVAAKEHHRNAATTDAVRRSILWVEHVTMQYGFEPLRLMGMLLVLVLMGAFLFTPTPLKGRTWRRKVLYSIDKAIPLISLDERNKQVELSDWPHGYFYFLAIAGFALVSVYIAGIIGVVQ